ncbi:MAG: acetyltransferase [Alphaproteobacteria bacterium]|nr:acetyltransferase [Alphaproteobacteria bacterium]
MEDILLHGLGTTGKLLLAEIFADIRYAVRAIVCDDKYYQENSYLGKPIYKTSEIEKFFTPNSIRVISTGVYSSMRERYASYLQLKNKGYNFINYISKDAIVANDIIIGENNIVFAGTYLDYFGKMGNCNIIRPNTYVGHNFDIHNGVYIAPNCSIAGYTTIEDLSFIGIGATIIEHRNIKTETLIGAASLVTKDTEPFSQYIGIPAAKIKSHKQTGILL